jgi:hypothetical protein
MTDNLSSAATTYRSAPSSVSKIGRRLAGTGRLHAGWKHLGFLLAAAACSPAVPMAHCLGRVARHGSSGRSLLAIPGICPICRVRAAPITFFNLVPIINFISIPSFRWK